MKRKMSLLINDDSQISEYSNYKNNNEQIELKEKQLNYAVNFFIIHRIYTSFELQTKNL